MRIKLTVENTAEIVKKLDAQGDKGLSLMKRATAAGAELVREEIRKRAPKDTGELANEGFVVKAGSKRKGGANAVVTISDRRFEYAFYLEFGALYRSRGGTLPAYPFIRPAFDKKRRAVTKLVRQSIRDELGLE